MGEEEEEEEEGMNYSWAQREGGREAATRKREGRRRGTTAVPMLRTHTWQSAKQQSLPSRPQSARVEPRNGISHS